MPENPNTLLVQGTTKALVAVEMGFSVIINRLLVNEGEDDVEMWYHVSDSKFLALIFYLQLNFLTHLELYPK